MKTKNYIEENRYATAKKKVATIKGFYRHLAVYLSVNIALTTVHTVNDMWSGQSFTTAVWDLQTFFIWIPWGIGLMIHGFCALDVLSFFMGKNWEEKKVKELMQKEPKNNTINWE